MSLRARLLAELNRPWRKDPLPVAALALAYAGPGAVAITIAESRFSFLGRDGAESFALDLDTGLTLGALAVQLNLHDGVTATVTPGLDAVLAATLQDEELRTITAAAISFGIWTSPTWRVLDPARRAILAAAARLDVAIAQLNLLTSAGFFADLWGTYTSTLRRSPAHLPVTGGTVGVTNGSMLAIAGNSTARIAWITALGPGASALFIGSQLEADGHVATIIGYIPKGTTGLGSTDDYRLILATPWEGPTAFTSAYRIVALPEADDVYTRRQVRELLRPRENNLALAIAITEDTGIAVREVRDLSRDVLIVSRTPLRAGVLAGSRFNAATAEVQLEDLPLPSVVAAAARHAAAGVHVLVLGTMHPPLIVGDLDIVVSPIVIGLVPPMQIGVTPIGGGRIAP